MVFCFDRDMDQVQLGLLQLSTTTVVEDPVVVVDDFVDRPDALLPQPVHRDRSSRWNSRKKCWYKGSHGVRGRKPRTWRDAN